MAWTKYYLHSFEIGLTDLFRLLIDRISLIAVPEYANNANNNVQYRFMIMTILWIFKSQRSIFNLSLNNQTHYNIAIQSCQDVYNVVASHPSVSYRCFILSDRALSALFT